MTYNFLEKTRIWSIQYTLDDFGDGRFTPTNNALENGPLSGQTDELLGEEGKSCVGVGDT
jgi:hypothetical protein